MLKHYFQQGRAEILRSRPLGLHLDSFANTLEQARYAPSTIRTKLRLLADLDDWLQRSGRTVTDLDEHGVKIFLGARRRCHRRHRVDRPTLRHFVEHLQHQGVIAMGGPVVPVEEAPTLKLERRYADYLRKERGLNAKTIENHRTLIHRFLLEHFGKEPLRLEALQAADLSRFIIKHRCYMGSKYAQAMVTGLRSSAFSY